MSNWPRLPRATTYAVGLAGIFLFTLGLTAATLIWNTQQTVLKDSEAQAQRFVDGAVTALNRSLLEVDLMLAGIDSELGLSARTTRQINVEQTAHVLYTRTQQKLTVREIALLDEKSRVIAASNADGSTLVASLPPGFVAGVLAEPVSTLVFSAPAVSFSSSDRVLYAARFIRLADGSKLLAIAELQVTLLSSILIQGVDISGLEVTLERSDGQLLASVPPQESLLGQVLANPLGAGQNASKVMRLPARLSGAPAIVVNRSLLYRDLLITASIPLDAALADWRTLRNVMLGMALLMALMTLGAAGFAAWDLNRLAQARRAIAQSKATLEQALESMVNGFLLIDAQYKVVSWNRRFLEMFPWHAKVVAPGVPIAVLLEQAAHSVLPNGSADEHAAWVAQRLGLLASANNTHEQMVSGGQVIEVTERRTPEGGVMIVYQNVTEIRKASAEIEQLAFFDPLTQLPNRRLLMDRLQQAMSSSVRSGRYGAILFMDLDNFKSLNDTQGHDVGDLLLQAVAQRLRTCVRQEDTVARLGGDEFVIMLDDLSEHSHEALVQAQRVGEKILEQLNQPYQLMEWTYRSTSSIGAAFFSPASLTASDLIKQADIAMYQAKSSGRNALCFFDPQMQADITARAQLEKDLSEALAHAQFELFYQPQVNLQGSVLGAEVLIRWHHPLRGLLLPGEFIQVAEECELIMPIGLWVLRTACEQLARWQGHALWNGLHLSVNVSARQFHQSDFVSQVATTLRETGARADLLKLELTESLVLANVEEAIAKMGELKALGVKFSVDDFGTGHSSLAYLTRLPLNQIKIDQSFVHNIGLQATDSIIVQTIIGMARNLGLEVIAEGVETRAQQDFLARHGCVLYQGYLYGRPAALAAFEALLGQAQQPLMSTA
jgi:diguanylate cyclase (GGDEF)-like protein